MVLKLKRCLTGSVLVLLSSLLSIATAQVDFEPGYFIDTEANRVDCLVRNLDWRNTPSTFKYKLPGTDGVLERGLDETVEFGVDGQRRFIRREIQFDSSSTDLQALTEEMEPRLKAMVVFLDVLVEGDATLYLYKDVREHFYLAVKDGSMNYLVNRAYSPRDNEIRYNRSYLGYLRTNLTCPDGSTIVDRKLRYLTRELTGVVTEYNDCVGSSRATYNSQKVRKLQFGVHLGVFSPALVQGFGFGDALPVAFNDRLGYRVGLLAEVPSVFNADRVSIILEPTLMLFSGDGALSASGADFEVNVAYTTLELPIGGRYHLYFDNGNKVYAEGLFIYDLDFNGTLSTSRSLFKFDIRSNGSYGVGVGYKHGAHLSVGARYVGGRNILFKFPDLTSRFSYLLAQVAYTF